MNRLFCSSLVRNVIFAAIASVVTTVAAADSTCLKFASNSDILSELNFRLNNGGGGGGGYPMAQASYLCSAYGDLDIFLIGPQGSEVNEQVGMRNPTFCQRQTQTLNAYRRNISAVTIIGVCNSYGDLERFSLTPDGQIRKLSKISLRDINRCLQQAESMNSGS